MSPRRHLTDAFKYLGRHLPVNKTYGQKPNPVNIPQVRNPLVLGTIGVGATVSAALYRVMRNRPELELARALETALSDFSGVEAACVRVQKGMASRRLNIQIQAVEGVDVERARGLAEDVLSAVWNASDSGPVAMMVEVRTADEQIVDAESLGFDGGIAYPHQLFARFGPPMSDPEWRP